MPAIALRPPGQNRSCDATNSLPQLLRTPSGLAVVELQGSVNSTLSDLQTGSDGAIPLGKLTFPDYDPGRLEDASWQKRVYLYVGKHQRLTGEVKKLSKPLALLKRKQNIGEDVEELEVAELVHYKILFAHRPEPVGGNVTG